MALVTLWQMEMVEELELGRLWHREGKYLTRVGEIVWLLVTRM